ncbi:MAG: TraR/DksA family transcriptional regulator [Kiritimatiellae bacterium]|nr:TraR/DksA family transcriptional regulator [Kiritimatiellia bacterium]
MAEKKQATARKTTPAKSAAKAAAKPAAKATKKVSAKAASKKPAARPAVKKPAAKKSAAMKSPAAKKPVAKAPAKNKVAARSAAKVAAPVKKPVKKTPAAKSAVKAATTKAKAPAKKPATPRKPASRPVGAAPQAAPAKKPVVVSIKTVQRNLPKRPISLAVLGKPDKALTKAELAKFRKALLALRDKVYRSVDAARQNVRHHNEADNGGDDGASIFDKFLALERAGNTKDILNRIDEALARVDDGTYGKCLSCGNPIRRVRLEVQPFSKYCISCQERLEKERDTRSSRP